MTRKIGDTARALIREAQIKARNGASAPAVVHELLTTFLGRIKANEELLLHWLGRGANSDVRSVLSRHFDNGLSAQTMRQEQLDMWPKELRATVAGIGRQAVFVPSREEFVELVPDALTKSEMLEASGYLQKFGEDCIRRAELLERLANQLDDEDDSEAA